MILDKRSNEAISDPHQTKKMISPFKIYVFQKSIRHGEIYKFLKLRRSAMACGMAPMKAVFFIVKDCKNFIRLIASCMHQ